jgi:hypothetical protein
VARRVRAEILPADQGLRRFLDFQITAANESGRADPEALADGLARGQLTPPPEGDPILKAAADFYLTLGDLDRRLLCERHLGLGTDRARAGRVGKSLPGYYRTLNRMLNGCQGFLGARGF